VSNQVFDLFREVTPLVEPLSLDEAYLDVTENAWHEALGMRVAQRLKQEILGRTQLTASAGVAPNKFLAKIASGWQKPDGLTVIAPGRVETFLKTLDVDALWGVGPVTAGKLRACGIARLVDVRQADMGQLRLAVGSQADWIRQLAHGIDPRPVVASRERKSAGSERTFAEDLTDVVRMQSVLVDLASGVAEWLARHDVWTRTVTIKVRYDDFTTVTRSLSGTPVQSHEDIGARAVALLEKTEARARAVRLLGVSAHNLGPRQAPSNPAWLPFDE
jgi:DNA polymerase IV